MADRLDGLQVDYDALKQERDVLARVLMGEWGRGEVGVVSKVGAKKVTGDSRAKKAGDGREEGKGVGFRYAK